VEGSTSPAVLVTGTSTGIGRATTRTLREVASSRVTPILLDVTDAAAVGQAAKDVAAALGDEGLAGLVNNAAHGVSGPLEFVDLEETRRGFDVNVFGPLALIRAFLPLLRPARGRIVNVTSAAGRSSTPFIGPYAASKFALEALSDSLRVELRSFGIRVAVIEPGFTATPMLGKGRDSTDRILAELPAAALGYYRRGIERYQEIFTRLGGRASPPEAVARAIYAALVSPRPKTRYAVGADAKLLVLLARWLPDRVKDAIAGRLHGL
jgi:NAD(P)-dependent dehydrogenase (short-subunit alcohol dehydrogenase family)